MKLFLLGLLTFVFLLPAQSKEATIEAQPLTFQSFSLSKSYVAPGDNAGLSLQFSLMPRHYIYSDSLRIKVVEPKEVLIDKVKAKSEIQFYDTHTKRIRRGLKGRNQHTEDHYRDSRRSFRRFSNVKFTVNLHSLYKTVLSLPSKPYYKNSHTSYQNSL